MLQAYKNNVIAEMVKEDKSKSSFLILPDQKKDYEVARIITIGNEVDNLNEGDLILFRHYSAINFEYEKKDYICMDAGSILAIVRDV